MKGGRNAKVRIIKHRTSPADKVCGGYLSVRMRRIIFAGTGHCSAAPFVPRRRSRHGSCGKGAARGHGGKSLKHPGRGVGGVTNTFCVFHTVRHWSRRQSTAVLSRKAKETGAIATGIPSKTPGCRPAFPSGCENHSVFTAFFAARKGPGIPFTRHAPHRFSAKYAFLRHGTHTSRLAHRNTHGRNAPGCFSGPEPRSAPHRSGRTENEWKNRGIRAE